MESKTHKLKSMDEIEFEKPERQACKSPKLQSLIERSKKDKSTPVFELKKKYFDIIWFFLETEMNVTILKIIPLSTQEFLSKLKQFERNIINNLESVKEIIKVINACIYLQLSSLIPILVAYGLTKVNKEEFKDEIKNNEKEIIKEFKKKQKKLMKKK